MANILTVNRGWSVILLAFALFFVIGFFSLARAEPASPINFTVTPKSACSIDLSWYQEGPGAFYFEGERSIDNFISSVSLRYPESGDLYGTPPAATGNFSTTDNGLVSNTEYWYRIRACDPNQSVRCSQNTIPTSSLTTLSLPSPPGSVNIESVIASRDGSLQNIDLSWATTTAISQHGGFSLFRSLDGGNTFSFLTSFDSYRTFYRDSDLRLTNSYAYYIRAYDSDPGCSVDPGRDGPTPTNQAVFSASSTAVVPKGPTGLSGSYDGSVMSLSWVDNADNEEGFEVWRSTDETFPAGNRVILQRSRNDSGGFTNFTDDTTTFAPNTTYYYKIRACTAEFTICSVFSDPPQPVLTGLANPVLRAGVVYTSSTLGTGKVYISWSGVTGAASYTVERSLSQTFDTFSTLTTKTADEFAADPKFYDQNVPLGETYYYRIRAVDTTDVNPNKTSFSNIQLINLDNLFILKGVAWAAIGDTPENNYAGLGWIKFNSAEENGVSSLNNYSVQVSRDGLFSGLAWATVEGGHGYGWLSFNQSDLVGCPWGNCEARLDLNTGEVSGWARFLTPKIRAGQSSWGNVDKPGWVSLRGVTQNQSASLDSLFSKIAFLIQKSPFSAFASLFDNFKPALAQTGTPYGVNYSFQTSRFSGVAWGGDVVGWIGFGSPQCGNCTVQGERVNRPPEVSNVKIEEPADSWCAANPFYRVRWDYSDPDGDLQQAAEIEFVKVSDSNVAFKGTLSGHEGSQNFYTLFNPLNVLPSTTTIKARVRVSDGTASSTQSESSATTTPTHYWPLVTFTMSPDPTATGTITSFNDTSSERSGGEFSLIHKNWQFENGSPAQSAVPNPSVVFSNFPAKVSLTVEDSSGASCLAERDITSGGTSGPLKRRIFRER